MMHSGVPRQTQIREVQRPQPPPDEDSLSYCCGSCDRFFSSAFGWLGWKGATFPLAFLGFSFFLATLSCLGFFQFTYEVTNEALYTPYDTDLFQQQTSLLDAGYLQERQSHVVLQSNGDDIFSPAYLHAVFDLHAAITATTVLVNGITYRFQDLCVRGTALGAASTYAAGLALNSKASVCHLQSIADYWNNTRATMASDPALTSTVFSPTTIVTDGAGRPVRTSDVVSTRSNAAGALKGAAAFQLTFSLLHRPTWSPQDDEPRDLLAEEWERAVLQNIEAIVYTGATSSAAQTDSTTFAATFAPTLTVTTPEQRRAALVSAKHDDRALVILGFLALWLLAIVVWFRRNWVRSRMGMSVVAVLTVVLAFASGCGACAGMGLDFNEHLLGLSFFLIAVGFGDSCVLMACMQPLGGLASGTPFDLNTLASTSRTRFWWIRAGEQEGVAATAALHQGDVSSEAAISVGAAAAGPFLTLTSLAMTLAFLIGAYTAIPSYRAVCLTAAVCLAYLWVFHFAFFIPALAIDAKRQEQLRCDWPFCCCPPFQPTTAGVEDKLCTRSTEAFDETDSSVCGSLIGTRLIDLILRPIPAAVCMLVALGVLAVSIWGVTGLSANLMSPEYVDLPRSHSAVRENLDLRARYFPDDAHQQVVRVYATREGTDFFSTFAAMDNLAQSLALNSYVVAKTIDFWWTDYLAFLAATAPWNVNVATAGLISNGRPISSSVFETSLSAFLATDTGTRYWADLMPLGGATSTTTTTTAASPLGGGLRAFRASVRLSSAYSTYQAYDRLASLRASVPYISSSSSSSSSFQVFPFADEWFLLESQHVIVWQSLRSVLLSSGVAFLLGLCLLANVWAAVLVTLVNGVVVLELFGILALVDFPFTPASLHGLLYAPMITLWLLTHPMHAFLRCLGTRMYRARKVLNKVGGIVVDFGVGLFLCTLFLAGARTPSYYSIFVTFGLLSVLGLFHALVVLPILLAHVGPVASWVSEIALSQTESTPAYFAGVPIADGREKKFDSSDDRDPANPFQQDRQQEFRPPPTNSAMEMQALVRAQQQPVDHPIRSFSAHGPTGSQLQNRGTTPQKPARQAGWQ